MIVLTNSVQVFCIFIMEKKNKQELKSCGTYSPIIKKIYVWDIFSAFYLRDHYCFKFYYAIDLEYIKNVLAL